MYRVASKADTFYDFNIFLSGGGNNMVFVILGQVHFGPGEQHL